MATTQEKLDAYLNRKYKGKLWRRLSREEIESIGDSDLLLRLQELDGIKNDDSVITDPNVWLPNEVAQSEEYKVWGAGGDIPDDVSNEQMDSFIDGERKRIYSIITAPPRSEKYLDAFHKKYPGVDIAKLKSGFTLSKEGVDSPEWSAVKRSQEQRHVRAKSLSHEQVSGRGPEDTRAIGHADLTTVAALHNEIYSNSGVDIASIRKEAPGRKSGDGFVKPHSFEIGEDEAYVPEEDLLHPVTYAQMPVDDLIKEQREKMDVEKLVRGIPPRA